MTQEEVRISTRKLCEDFEPMDDIEEFIRGVALSALDALEEAHKEIERLKVRVCSLHCSDDAKSEDHERGCPFYIGTYA